MYQSEHGTSVDQTIHVNIKKIAPWFDNARLPNVINSPFPSDPNFELNLLQFSPFEGDKLQLWESCYHGPFSHTIGKSLLIRHGYVKTLTLLSLILHHLQTTKTNEHFWLWST